MLRLTRSLTYLQPQGLNAQIDWDNPLTEGLILAVRPHARRNDVNGRVALGLGAGMTDTIGQVGLERTQAASQNTGDRYGNLGLTSAQATHLQLLRVPTGTLTGSRSSGSWIAASRGFAFLHQSNNFRAVRSTAGLNNVLTSVTNPTATASRNRPFVLVHVLGSAAQGIGSAHWHELWVNGKSEAYSAFGVPFTLPASGDEYVVGVSGAATGGDSAASYTASYGLQLVWNRALKDAEVARISANPWQIYRGPQIWVPVGFAVGGGISYSLTPASLAHAQTVSAPSLATGLGLAPGAISHAQSVSVPSISTSRSLPAGSLSHEHTFSAPSVSGAGALAAVEMTHSQSLSTPSLSTVTAIAAAALAHAQSLADASLGASYPLSAAAMVHTLSLEAAVASTLQTLTAAAMVHAHTLSESSASTTGAANLIAAALSHASTLGVPSLSTLISLAPGALAHAQTLAAASISATTGAQLTAAALAHVHTFGAASLSTQRVLSAVSLAHTLSLGATTLTTTSGAALSPEALSHEQILAAVVLSTVKTITPSALLHQHALSAVQLIYDDGSAESLVGKKIHLLIQRRQFTSHKQSDGSLVVVFHPISLVDITDNKCIC